LTSETLNADIKPILEEELNEIKAGSDAKKLHEAFKSESSRTLTNDIKG